MPAITVRGRVKSVKFWSPFNGETLARIVPQDPNSKNEGYYFRCHFAHEPVVGENLVLIGDLHPDAAFGQVLRVSKAERKPPTTREGEVQFLSGYIKGMSRKKAEELLNHFGSLQALITACSTERDKVEAVLAKANKLKLRLFAAQWDRREMDVDLFAALHAAKLRSDQINRLVRHFGVSGLKVIAQTKPYALCEAPKVGYATAEKVAIYYAREQKRALNLLDPLRLLHGVTDVLGRERTNGHVCVPEKYLLERCMASLGVENRPLPKTDEARAAVTSAIAEAVKQRMIVRDFDMLYTRGMHRAESELALHISKLKKMAPPADRRELRKAEQILADSVLTDEQKQAVTMAISEAISVITGGPGCGKTLTISKLVEIIKSLGRSFMVLAPTGKAAKRASEVMGEEASTIHRACALDQDEDIHSKRYGKKLTKQDYFHIDYVIVDEVSMCDVLIAFEMVRRIRPGATRIIFIGDVDQLPPVGPGQFFRDILNSGSVPVQRLTKIWRQEGGSPVIDLAYGINRGEIPHMDSSWEVRMLDPLTSKRYDSSLDKESRDANEEQIIFEWLRYSLNRYKEERGVDPLHDVSIYAPQNPGPAGIIRLNEFVREILNPLPARAAARQSIRIRGGFVVQVGDKVMQCENNYVMRYAANVPDEAFQSLRDRADERARSDAKRRKGKKRVQKERDRRDIVPVMNGQVGYVTRTDPLKGEMEVKFDDLPHPILYRNSEEWRRLTPAYAISIHRSQGSETPYAFIVMHSTMRMLNRPLLYTGVTRAKKGVLLLAPRAALERCIANVSDAQRYSCLDKRLAEYGKTG